MQPGSSPYIVLMDTVEVISDKVTLELLNTKNTRHLRLELSGLEGNMARLRVLEKDPIKERYEPAIGDVLVDEPQTQRSVPDQL